MKKKLSLLFALIFALTGLTGCKEEGDINTNTQVSTKEGLVVLCEHYLDNLSYCRFIRDTYTDNIYMTCFEKQGYGGGGGLLPYYNSKGEIMKYDEFQKVHVH